MTDKLYRQIEENLLVSELAGELVLMHTETGEYFGLNNLGMQIWNLMASPISLPTIVDRLVSLYDISPEQCSIEVSQFILALERRKLISNV